jgi:arylsulfatase A
MKHLVLVFAFLMVPFVRPAEKEVSPNIVFILADDLGWNDLGCYGRKEHHTPNLDQLAREGSRFTCAYAAQPICSPSRAAILTGKAPARLRLTTYLPGRADCNSQKLLHPIINQHLPLEEKSVAEYLRDAGYATGYIGKWHLGNKGFLPTEQGFDFYHAGDAVTKPSAAEGGKGEYDLTRQAIQFIETNRARPFFLYLAHNSPHIPYSARADLVEKNKAAFEPVYAGLIETLDDSVSLVLKKIDQTGLSGRTLVIFTSDHGGLHVPEGTHRRITHNTPFRAGKGFLYEGGLRVPLIVRWPGKVPAGKVVEIPVNNTDWLPTFLELAGVSVPPDLDGMSILPILLGRDQSQERTFYWHYPHYTNQGSQPAGAIRKGKWKLIENYEDGRLELYELSADIAEKNDLAVREPNRAASMQRELVRWRDQVSAQTNRPNADFSEASFAKLYVNFVPSKFDPLGATPEEWERVWAWRTELNAALRANRRD